MLTQQRKHYILDSLKKEGRVVAKTLATELGLSEDTIRRDLRELAKEGLLQRVHGGALPASSALADFTTRQTIASDGKLAIARAAATLIQSGQIVILDGGTTTVQVARQLPKTLAATVVTHSPSIAIELVNHPAIDVVLIGGKLFKHSVVTVGAAALEALSHIHADMYFMGLTGIHPDIGLTTGDLEEAHMKKALSQHAAETIVLASHEKLGVASAYVITPVSQVSTLIVEHNTAQELLTPYEKFDLDIIRA
ncbi:MAG: DeoR/GlpR transcriptional regulator [Trueperaceae bacterium]|nr:DeoR/GlpR transcriptional regulator [Trueperaceae bacterium]